MLLISFIISIRNQGDQVTSPCMSPCRSDFIFTNLIAGVWREVSEDSDQVGTRLAVIHSLSECRNLEQPTYGEMQFLPHQLDALSELFEIKLFRSSQSVPPKKWNDRSDQIISSRNAESIQVLFMVVVPPIEINISHIEELPEHVETLDASRTLCHCKLMRHLMPGLITSTTWSMRLSHEMDRKASFAVDKTGNPTNFLDQPFLLIFRSCRIVTAVRRG
jgi:hypothetical protein